MLGLKHSILAVGSSVALACLPVAPAAAHGHGFLHPWGIGRGLVGAVVAVATLPLAIAAAALSVEPPEPYYQGPPQGYYPQQPGYYAAPSYYAAPPRYGYAPAPYYRRESPGYYAPRGYAGGRDGYHGSYRGNAPYRSGGSDYRH